MDLSGFVPGGTGGMVGAVFAAVMGAAWFIRIAWRTDKVEVAKKRAEIDIIARLSEQLDKANARADLAEKRADDAYRERNDAYRSIGTLEAKIAALEIEVKMMREQIHGKDDS